MATRAGSIPAIADHEIGILLLECRARISCQECFSENEMATAATQPAKSRPGETVNTGFFSLRSSKIAASFAILAAGSYGIFSDTQYISSSDAVVSAYVASVRTPIEGTVRGMPTSPGGAIRAGSPLGRVDNPRVDEQRLQTLRDIANEARNGTASVAEELAAMRGQRYTFVKRAKIHAEAVAARLRLSAIECRRLLAAKSAARHQAFIELNRGRSLHDSGIIADAEIDRLQTQYEVAVHEEEAQRADLAVLRAEEESAKKGILIEPGITDVSYSSQRADEINLRLLDVTRALAAMQSQGLQADADVMKESQRAGLLRSADLTSPMSGIVWKIEAMNGEHVAAGDSVAQIVDCDQQFVLVEVPQERVPDIAFGGIARFRLSGEAVERTGIILSVLGDPKKEADRKLAALPATNKDDSLATLRVAFNNSQISASCNIGRTLRVLLPTNGRGVLARWYRHFF
jgi:multidrug resistance efflux pump